MADFMEEMNNEPGPSSAGIRENDNLGNPIIIPYLILL